MLRRGAAVVVALVCAFAVLASCSVPDDESVRMIDRDKMPFHLADPSTSTTTITVAPPVSTTLPSTAPASTSATNTTILASSPYGPPVPTLPPIVPDPVQLYFVVGDSMAEITRVMPIKPELIDLVGMLAAGPFPGETDLGPRTALEFDDVTTVYLRAGTLTVDVAPKFRELPPAEQRRAIAQLVLTFTNRGGIGQVTFTSEGRRFEVPRANGTFGATTVSRDDYASMLLPPVTTTALVLPLPTTTTEPPTTTTKAPLRRRTTRR